MIRNYFRTAARYLLNNGGYSVFNIIGLAIGLAAFWQVFLYVQKETSYDKFHKKGDRIVRAATNVETQSGKLETPFSAPALAIFAKQTFPEIESTVRVSPASLLFTNGNIKYQEDNCLFVDSSFFRIFDFPLISGSPGNVLSAPFEVVLSQSAAKKYFGSTDPVGKTLLLSGGKFNIRVTGIMKDLPVNTQFKADILISMPTALRFGDTAMDRNWSNVSAETFFLLRPSTNYKALEAKMPRFLEERVGNLMRQSQTKYKIVLEPLEDIYLHSKRGGVVSGNLINVYTFACIGLFILLIACINFINLSTARSVERAKEVGIRKLIGAERRQLTFQFLAESVILAAVSFLLSIVVTILVLPIFNQLAGKTISKGIISEHPINMLIMLLISLFIGILAGAYPALTLSSFKPITVLKGSFTTSKRGALLRRALVVIQFTICIAMIVATVIVYRQLQYMRNSNLGFKNEQILVIDTHWDPNRLSYRDRITNIPGIKSTSLTSNVPGDETTMNAPVQFENSDGIMKTSSINQIFVDFDFIPQFSMDIISGRNFSSSFQSDSGHAMVINESLLHLLGFRSADQAIGKRFIRNEKEGTIIGVVKDFHYRYLRERIQPLCFNPDPANWRFVCVKLKTDGLAKTMDALENVWKTTIPQRPFSFYFADDYFNEQYRTDENFGKLFVCFSILTIIISSIGLVGLSSYSTLQRKKEIGVRKLLGASVLNIVKLLSIEFLKLIAIALVFASIIIWFPIHAWLEEFQYRRSVQWWVFIAAGGFVLLIAFATISIHVVKAAISNPVKSLKSAE
ncbi:MAG TPA: ABC transporter permease [Arachidicoccus sp.]|nr:ABC transporter permease [Arachidicoccus sp.]